MYLLLLKVFAVSWQRGDLFLEATSTIVQTRVDVFKKENSLINMAENATHLSAATSH